MASKKVKLALAAIIWFAGANGDYRSMKPITQKGIASYYADKFEGRTTANGETFRQDRFTAAHKKLPFGTKVLVRNHDNGKEVLVTINDRGPFVKGRIIDLSKAAAKELDILDVGLARVSIEVVQST